MLVQQLVNGLTIGAIYGLVGLGFALIYGVLDLVNFAHGDVYMVGAFVAFSGLGMGLGFWPTLIITILITALLGIFIEKIAYKPIRKAPAISQLVSSLALAIVLRNIAMLIWGSHTVPFPNLFGEHLQMVIPIVVFVLVLVMHLVLTRTKLGTAVRATSMDRETASALGVNVDRIISMVFAIGSGLGGLAGILVGMYYSSISFDMGAMMGLKAFIAAIVGGLGSIYGAIVGGVLLGVSESLAGAYISPAYKNALAFIILVIVLLVRPAGLLGRNVEKGG